MILFDMTKMKVLVQRYELNLRALMKLTTQVAIQRIIAGDEWVEYYSPSSLV